MQTDAIATLSTLVIVVMTMSIGSASAEPFNFNNFSPSSPIGFKIQSFIHTVTESFTLDPQDKAELKVKHAQEIQEQIETLDQNNQLIPIEYEQVRIQKLEEAKDLVENQTAL